MTRYKKCHHQNLSKNQIYNVAIFIVEKKL